MMLDHPSPSRHLPAKIEVRHRPQAGKKGVQQRKDC